MQAAKIVEAFYEQAVFYKFRQHEYQWRIVPASYKCGNLLVSGKIGEFIDHQVNGIFFQLHGYLKVEAALRKHVFEIDKIIFDTIRLAMVGDINVNFFTVRHLFSVGYLLIQLQKGPTRFVLLIASRQSCRLFFTIFPLIPSSPVFSRRTLPICSGNPMNFS